MASLKAPSADHRLHPQLEHITYALLPMRQLPVLSGNAVAGRYAALERQLGEVDRARAILVHASSLADPRVNPQFWADWNEFEVRPAQLPAPLHGIDRP